jgi:gas vesicle protein
MIGAAAGILFMPQMSWKTRKKFMRAGKRMSNLTSGLWDNLKDMRS